MITLIQNLPDNVLGFEASGVVSANDYETVLMPAVEAALKKHRKVRLLYQLGASFQRFELGAVWEDTKIGLQHLSSWEKIAVVTDVDWIRSSVKVFGFAVPGEVKIFANAGLAEAKQWLTAA